MLHHHFKRAVLKEPAGLELQSADWAIAQDSAGSDTCFTAPDGSICIQDTKDGLLFENRSGEKISLTYKNTITLSDDRKANCCVCVDSTAIKNAGGCLYLNGFELAMTGRTAMEITPPVKMELSLQISANSSLLIRSVRFLYADAPFDLTDSCAPDKDVLVVVPGYPSAGNLYLSAFAHTRNRAYVDAGLRVQVAVMTEAWYCMEYTMDELPVYYGPYSELKKLLARKQFKTIVIHFVGEEHYPALDGLITNERLIFINHGPETTFEILPNKCRNYFTAPIEERVENPDKRAYVRKYARKENVEWVFVSEFLKNKAEELMDISFRNAHVIGNYISEERFPYSEKTAEDRKKILVLRKFDNIRVHSIDQVVLAISALSRKSLFSDLTFDIYGDGSYYEELVAPLRRFENVHLHRTFIPNDQIHTLYDAHGILLIPSRHDAHAVTMSEAGSAGMVVVGSNVTSNPYYMDEAHNHTLADPEDPIALAGIIERLYYDPDEFLAISKRLSDFVHQVSSRENTIDREIALINRCRERAIADWDKLPSAAPEGEPVLTVLVAAYNVEPWLGKCLYSLVNHRNAGRMEVLVVNDGSKDRTSEIAHAYEKATNGVVRVIDKPNGGHGSTINVGIAEARGTYFRIVDGDDWVDSENLAILIDKLENETADVVLTKGCYDYSDKEKLESIIEYDMLEEGYLYQYDDLLFPGYGFDTYGPLLTTGNYRIDVLRRAGFRLSEKKPYVDMEFNAYSQRYLQTLRYWDLDIYRYLIGRAGQTVSPDFWKSKYEVHASIIFSILETLDQMEDFPPNRKIYLYAHLIAMMADSQVFMYDQVRRWDEIDPFLDKLRQWPEAYAASMDYIKERDNSSQKILEHYRNYSGPDPLILPDNTLRELSQAKSPLKRLIRAITPYGLVIFRRKRSEQ